MKLALGMLLAAVPCPFARAAGAADWIDFDDLGRCGAAAESAVYKVTPSGNLTAEVYAVPAGGPTPPRAALVFVHGGGWTAGSPLNHREHSRYFAARGMVVFNLSYRLIPSSGTGIDLFDQVGDIRSALRWVRTHAAALGVDPARVAIAGESAGGHLAACASFIDAFDDPSENPAVSAKPDLALLLNPITDLPRIPWYADSAARVGEKPLPVEDTPIANPLDETIHPARRLSPLFYATRPGQPPALFVHGDADGVVPFAQSKSLHDALIAAGHESELVALPGTDHAFFIPGYGSKHDITTTLLAMDAFLSRHGYLHGPVPLLGLDLNRLANGGFEDGLASWTGSGAQPVEAAGASPRSLRFARVPASTGLDLRQTVPLAAFPLPVGAADSELLTVKLRGFLRAMEPADAALARVTLRCLDATGTLLTENTVGWTGSVPGTWSATSWEQLVPPRTASFEIVLATAANPAAAIEFDDFTLSLGSTTRAGTYADWQKFYFTPAELADPRVSGPDISLPGGTPPHRMKYAFRLPRSAGTTGWPRAVMAADRLGLRFRLDPRKTDIDYRVVFGSDPSTLTGPPAFSSAATAVVPDASATVTIADPTPALAAPRRFGRVEILAAPPPSP
jgi:acetyl esterase